MADNHLHYGDNLDVLREYVADGSVDLVYLDPPFNSQRAYNVLFDKDGDADLAQMQAFDDTWHWTHETEDQFNEYVSGGLPYDVADALGAFRRLLGDNDMMAYLVNMAPRFVELQRVLKPTGSLYLHCDATASHYLKMLLDSIFGLGSFVNEIVWKRSSAHSDARQGAQHYGRVSDTILFYAKSAARTWNQQYQPYDQAYIDRDYRRVEAETGRRYRIDNLQGPGGKAKGNPYYEVMGVSRYWRYSREKMAQLIAEGRVIQTRPGAVPQYKRYLDEMPGVPLQNVWTDIDVINNRSNERLGYPTQKPLSLLARILKTSSNEGDVVLDPFCGCGTTIDAAVRLNRRWIGIDVTFIAADLIQKRLLDSFGAAILATYDVTGIPRDLAGARALFKRSPFEFERWAVSLVDGTPNEKQVGDKGMDGVIRFHHSQGKGPADGKVLVSVKGGTKLNPSMVQALDGAMSTHSAQMGIFVTLNSPTPGMVNVVDRAGSYTWPFNNEKFPRLQILTVAELLKGKRPRTPPRLLPYISAVRQTKTSEQIALAL